jgi:hypothetical protein
MVRIKGFEQIAEEQGDVWDLVTWTLPSRFHPHSDKYAGLTPKEGQEALNTQWTRARAKLARQGLKVYGVRVAEPHKDGCPHWHSLLFFPEAHREQIRAIIREYALADSPDEPGAQENRIKFVAGDPERGGAAGYVAKYVSKNIDAYGVEPDLSRGDADPQGAAARVDAWASTWGIRQFQFIGGPPVSVWRELRRLDSEEAGIIEECRKAADAGDWAAYVRAQGGPSCGRDHLVKLARWEELDPETGELSKPPVNHYGESRAADVMGVTDGTTTILTRVHIWKISQISSRRAPQPWACRVIVDPIADLRPGASPPLEFCQ